MNPLIIVTRRSVAAALLCGFTWIGTGVWAADAPVATANKPTVPATAPAALAPIAGATATPAAATKPAGEANGVQVLEAFDRQQVQRVDSAAEVPQKKKQLIMFMLGIPLLILLLSTGAVGIAMGVFGKPLFLLHMILAGLTMTLALVHVIVGLVWFYPF
jgi:hypothetical protein